MKSIRERGKIKTKKKEKIGWVGYSSIMIVIILCLLIIVGFYGRLGPSNQSDNFQESKQYEEFGTINRNVSILADQSLIDLFNCELPGLCEKMDAKAVINATILNKTGNINVYINDLLVGENVTINQIGSYDLGCYCGCVVPGCNCYVYPGENEIEIISYGFEGRLNYKITLFQEVN